MSCMHFFMSIAVTDFSFVSSVVGVPFATIVNALTVTRCESADRYVVWLFYLMHTYPGGVSEGYSHSCSQCLQTNNACGWCIYNNVCSGTPAPCTNETNWYQVSLLWLHDPTSPAFPNKEWNVFEMYVTYNMNTLFYMSCIPKKDWDIHYVLRLHVTAEHSTSVFLHTAEWE